MAAFHITHAVRSLCEDMTRRTQALSHIDMSRVAIGFTQTRKPVSHGIQASLTPLRFEGGKMVGRINKKQYVCQRLVAPSGKDYLYLLRLYLPRLLDQPFEEKLTTIVHELWHISPAFDGDLRRHEGRCYIHGTSQEEFDATAASIARQWLAANPPESLYEFLLLTHAELVAEHGGVCGERFPAPKLMPLRSA